MLNEEFPPFALSVSKGFKVFRQAQHERFSPLSLREFNIVELAVFSRQQHVPHIRIYGDLIAGTNAFQRVFNATMAGMPYSRATTAP